jgi:hypothetical protein
MVKGTFFVSLFFLWSGLAEIGQKGQADTYTYMWIFHLFTRLRLQINSDKL